MTFTALGTYGEYYHTLTYDEMPLHSHAQYVTAMDGNQSIRKDFVADGSGNLYPQGCNTGNAGNDKQHNNIQPSMGAYYWRRVS